MFIAALFIMVKTWKQLKWPAVGEWINTLWCIQTKEYYLALKINEVLKVMKTHRGTLMNNTKKPYQKATMIPTI